MDQEMQEQQNEQEHGENISQKGAHPLVEQGSSSDDEQGHPDIEFEDPGDEEDYQDIEQIPTNNNNDDKQEPLKAKEEGGVEEGSNPDENATDNEKMDREQRKIDKRRAKRLISYTYRADRVVGQGSFGVVFAATIAETGNIVAIKKVVQDKRYKNREVQIIRELYHPNIIGLRHAFYTQGDKPDELFLNMVMDYIPESCFKILKHYNKMKQPIPLILVKLYSYQLFRALAYLQALGIAHRDLKPQNMLIDPTTHCLKLCDFGSAKRLVKGETNVSYMTSRFYRAPELIFGSKIYDCSIDMWSAGTIIAELMLGQPIFPGDSGIDQLVEIIKVLGTPSRDKINSMNPNYTDFRFPHVKPHPWNKIFRPKTPSHVIDLISKLLMYNPSQRLKPMEAMQHQFFDQLRERDTKLPNGQQLPDLFDFCEEEISSSSPEQIRQLIPTWYIERKGIKLRQPGLFQHQSMSMQETIEARKQTRQLEANYDNHKMGSDSD